MEYKGYWIDCETFNGMITVFYAGDEFAFKTIEKAKEFIDQIA